MMYCFGDCTLDTARRILSRGQTVVNTEPKVFDLLVLLLQQREQFVSRETLFELLWPNQVVSDASLTYCMAEARKAVGDSGRTQRLIKTLHGRGYRFIGAVTVVEEAPPGRVPPPEPTRTPVVDARVAAEPVSAAEAPLALAQAPAPASQPVSRRPGMPEAERRQLTVLWCRWAILDRTSSSIDPEALLQVVQEAQRLCDEIIAQFDGRTAQQYAEGFTAYFGHPQAHEDDAYRAVRAGLAMLRGLVPLARDLHQRLEVDLALQVGIHTGMTVIGRVGRGEPRAQLAVGSTPQIAARLVSLAAPNTVVISAATLQLVEGYVIYEPLGCHMLDQAVDMLVAYQVLGESEAQSRLEVGLLTGLTPFVGREQEMRLLQALWERSQEGSGQVVVINGEAGIGKSRLVRVFHEQLADTPHTRIEWRCSAYAQHSALHPVLMQLHHWLQWQHDDPPHMQFQKLEAALQAAGYMLAEAVPAWAALLSLSLPDHYTALTGPPERLKQQILAAVVTWLLRQTAQQPVCLVLEDGHWLDPSTLELLTLLLDQVPTSRLFIVLTCRPEGVPSWTGRSYVTQIALNRLSPPQTARLITRVVEGKTLPPEVQQQLVAKTNGVPLFVEELTKMVLEIGLVKERDGRYELAGPLPSLAIPSTLHDSLMARLDRQATGKLVAQLGATVGREFSYTLLQAIAPVDEATLQDGLAHLVRAEILYQRGLPPQAQYLFKHALLQDAAYHSLLNSTRRYYHQQIAQTLEASFPDTLASQPELVAYHYTEAGCHAQAVTYWQRAGQRALEQSAYVEALKHLEQGLTVLARLPASLELTEQELGLQMALGTALMAVKGQTAPEVIAVYARAHALCQQLGGGRTLFPVLLGLWRFYGARAELHTALELAEQLMQVAESAQEPALRLDAHMALGNSLLFLGKLARARTHFAHGIALYESRQHGTHPAVHGRDPGVVCYSMQAITLWKLGYPEQALALIHQALTYARELAHPLSLAFVLCQAATLAAFRQEPQQVLATAEEAMALARDHGLGPWISGQATVHRGWALVLAGHGEAGIDQMQQGLRTLRQIQAELPWSLFQLVDGYRRLGQVEHALHVLSEVSSPYWFPEARALPPAGGAPQVLPEMSGLYWLKGESLLQLDVPQREQAEACFLQALELARVQEARSDALRAAMSLCRLWQAQGQGAAARALLQTCYDGFTEGLATPELRAAQALLATLA